MVTLNAADNYFDYKKKHPEYKNIVYGTGNMTREYFKYLGHIDFFCDKKAKEIGSIENIICLLPEELESIHDKLIIVICIRQKSIASEVYSMLEKLEIDAEVFHFFEDTNFAYFNDTPFLYQYKAKDVLKIHIVNFSDGWIFEKFAVKLKEELEKLGHEVDISDKEEPAADINHFIHYGRLWQICSDSDIVRTTMITHVDCQLKVDLIKFQAKNNVVGICMSADTMNKLSIDGVPRESLCYVNPAQDGEIEPRKIVLGITNRCYNTTDFRKRDDMILKVFEQLENQYFKLKIMGAGWEEIVAQLCEMGFEVEYHNEFDRQIYKQLIPSLDYWLYYGFDEGAMGYLDALAAGIKTIATPQGYHLDTECGLTFACSTIDDFIRVLSQIQEEKRKITESVKNWTWENYARKHLEVWQYLTKTKSLKDLYAHQNEYLDGIFSMVISNNSL